MTYDIPQLIAGAEKELRPVFDSFDEISNARTGQVLDAFREFRVDDTMFGSTSGYGYDDKGRDTLDRIFARVLGAESGFVRHSIANGTHALTIALWALLRPGDVMLAITGRPYDTLMGVIGLSDRPVPSEDGAHPATPDGSLLDFGVFYDDVPFGEDWRPKVRRYQEEGRLKVVYIQRSRGYADRPTLSSDEINAMISEIRTMTGAYVIVDNCYGEFSDLDEPKGDLVVGSLIKNPGGGIAEAGAYIVGTPRAVELAGYRMTTVGAGVEVGASLGNNKNMYKGLFFAPHIVAQAKKTAALAAYVFEALGCDVSPGWRDGRHDIIQTLRLGSPERLCAFCRGIQYASPVDSYVTPEPWDMPGYDDKVIMAAGAFTQGSSIELSADGPMREPYIAFMQGGLTYESGRYAVRMAAEEFIRSEKNEG